MFHFRDMFGQSLKSVPKKRFWPQSRRVNARMSSDRIFQIAVISKYVSKFGLDPFSDLKRLGVEKKEEKRKKKRR